MFQNKYPLLVIYNYGGHALARSFLYLRSNIYRIYIATFLAKLLAKNVAI